MSEYIPCLTIRPTDNELSYRLAVEENPNNAASSGNGSMAVGLKSKFWRNFQTLSVGFLDQISSDEKKAFQKAINKWTRLVNLNIVFVADARKAIIRIKTKTQRNSSAVGTDALTQDYGTPTMYIGVNPKSAKFEATVLHEFGHALGFEHEHLHPDAHIPWNREKVYNRYRFSISREEIDDNFFNPINEPTLYCTEYDRDSIMHYHINKELTDGKLEVKENLTLSSGDMYLAMKVYPETPED
ncbi:M12 family metallopeptidase [Pseudomonas sp. NPDC089534]|uniref:M12 family metallopeptidase n=1 Tax=Pseudomonas sp. NPDC089534 TaxID=3364468 RepID=UPI00380C775E